MQSKCLIFFMIAMYELYMKHSYNLNSFTVAVIPYEIVVRTNSMQVYIELGISIVLFLGTSLARGHES